MNVEVTSCFHYNKWRLWGGGAVKKNEGKMRAISSMSCATSALLMLTFKKENIFPVILLQPSEAGSCHRRQTARTKVPGARTEREGLHPSSNQYQYFSDVSNSKKCEWGPSGEFSAAVSQPPKTQADVVISLPLSRPC